MGLHLESGRYVFHCDACPSELETDTAVLIDASAFAGSSDWYCTGNEWYCPPCALIRCGITHDPVISA
jgi:hypothetical protein